MRRIWNFLTSDWLNKVLALGLAVIIFVVVDKKITDEFTTTFTVRFGQFDPEVQGNTIFVALQPGYTASLESPAGDDGDRDIRVHFTGPRQVILDLKRGPPLLGTLSVDRTIQDEKTVEDVWTIVGSQIRFGRVDPGVTVTAPNLRIRVLRLDTRWVDVAANLEWFQPDPGYRLGDPHPDRDTVRVTCPARFFNFDVVRLDPVARDDEGSEGKRHLVKEGNRRLFRVIRPRNVPDHVHFVAEPVEINVDIPLVPLNEKMDIEVPIVLCVPTDGRLGPTIPRTSKTRETFTFIGPPSTLKRCKKLEGTDQEIQAVIDLTRLGADRIRELQKGDGIRVKPTFFYPASEASERIQCEQPKDIWVHTSSEK